MTTVAAPTCGRTCSNGQVAHGATEPLEGVSSPPHAFEQDEAARWGHDPPGPQSRDRIGKRPHEMALDDRVKVPRRGLFGGTLDHFDFETAGFRLGS